MTECGRFSPGAPSFFGVPHYGLGLFCIRSTHLDTLAMILGWFVLVPFCLAQAWTRDAVSIKDGRTIDRWRYKWLWPFDNPEDGPSGQTALVWVNGVISPYMPNAWAPWRAYCWSAWRNSADNLKYVFKWVGGPFWRWQFRSFYVQAGWGANGLPVLSTGRL